MDSSASRIHASFVLILLDAPLPQFFTIILQSIAGATDVSNFLRAFFDGFFEFRILGDDEIDPIAIFVRFQGGAFPQTTFASPSA